MTFRNKIILLCKKLILSKRERLAESNLIAMLDKALKYSNVDVKVIFEIGANHGQDTKRLQQYYQTLPHHTFMFEPHPVLADELRRNFKDFRVFECALSDKTERQSFNITKVNSRNDGVSTLGERVLVKGDEHFEQVEVLVTTLDKVMEDLEDIDSIDIMKIDVEGFTYEVLKGGENTFRKKVACIQVESETAEVFKGQKLYAEISALLQEFGFIEMYKEQFVTQNDTVWIHRRHLKSPEEFYLKKKH